MAEKKINYTAEKINTLLNEVENINSIDVIGYEIWEGTLSEYEAIANKSNKTIYLIKE